MEVLQKDNGKKGHFYIVSDEKMLAEMPYTWAGFDKFIIDHTHVSHSLSGKNAGKLMLSKAIEFARKKGLKIIPLCPFCG
jgi:uncharacterized protein